MHDYFNREDNVKMAGKLTVLGFNEFVLAGKVDILIDGKIVASVVRKEKAVIHIERNCTMTIAYGLKHGSNIQIEDGKHTVVQLKLDTWTNEVSTEIVKTETFAIDSNNPKTEKPIYEVDGARGRHIMVFEDKCVISTKVTLGSIITGNATDGEKTIYYLDCIGVQFKKSGLTIGYIQLETASSSMNNRATNFWNENSFTFDGDAEVNYKMEEIANYIKKQIEECKRAKAAPLVVASSISSADELKKFKDLLDSGIITQEEFDAKKKQLLDL